jgi:hypothetical protein
LQPFVRKKQREAVRAAKTLVPGSKFQMMYRYPLLRLALSRYFLKVFLAGFGSESILAGYP